jgi:hypothetical protein
MTTVSKETKNSEKKQSSIGHTSTYHQPSAAAVSTAKELARMLDQLTEVRFLKRKIKRIVRQKSPRRSDYYSSNDGL